MKKTILTLSLILCIITVRGKGLYSATAKGYLNAGITSANFLKILPGANSFALGDAVVSDPDKASAIFHNSANIQMITDPIFRMSYIDWLFNLQMSELSFGMFIPQLFMPLEVSYINMISDDIGHTVDSHFVDGYFRVGNRALLAGTAFPLNKNLIFGGVAKIVNQQFYATSSYGLIFDVSGIYITNKEAIQNDVMRKMAPRQMGFAIRNIGFMSPAVKEVFIPPVTFALGATYRVIDNFNIYMQMTKEIDYFLKLNVAAQYKYLDILEFNFGTSFQNRAVDLGLFSHISFGIGVDLGTYKINYGYRNMGMFGSVQQVSITADFGSEYKGGSLIKGLHFKKRKKGEEAKGKASPQVKKQTKKKSPPAERQKNAEKKKAKGPKKVKAKSKVSAETVPVGVAKPKGAVNVASETPPAKSQNVIGTAPISESEIESLLSAPTTETSVKRHNNSETAVLPGQTGNISETDIQKMLNADTASDTSAGESGLLPTGAEVSETDILGLISDTSANKKDTKK